MLLRSDPRQSRKPLTTDRKTRMGDASAGPTQGAGNKGSDDKGGGPGGKNDTATITRPKTRSKRPNLYRVLLLNDDYTPMEFVVLILQDVFNKTREDAMLIMLHVHNHGVGECGIYPYEVAETKVTRVMDAARKSQHPLQCVMEKQ
jgi:ATP-dependent Clp protease adaptor protein ClpS